MKFLLQKLAVEIVPLRIFALFTQYGTNDVKLTYDSWIVRYDSCELAVYTIIQSIAWNPQGQSVYKLWLLIIPFFTTQIVKLTCADRAM